MAEQNTNIFSRWRHSVAVRQIVTFMQRLYRLPALASLAIAACASPTPALYDNEEFVSGNAYSHTYAANGADTCEAARRALLSQGYIITETKPTLTKGVKNFQRDRNSHAEIEFHVVCAPDSEGSNTTTAFANAVRQTYSLKKSSNSASVGVGVLGSLSVPFGLSDDAMVKVGAETLASKKFYEQFFTRVEGYLDIAPHDKGADGGSEPYRDPDREKDKSGTGNPDRD